jgi:hypothetical protein
MLVGLDGECRVPVSQPLGYHLDGDAGFDEQGAVGVADVMEPNLGAGKGERFGQRLSAKRNWPAASARLAMVSPGLEAAAATMAIGRARWPPRTGQRRLITCDHLSCRYGDALEAGGEVHAGLGTRSRIHRRTRWSCAVSATAPDGRGE